MIYAALLLWVVVVILTVAVRARKGPEAVTAAGTFAWGQAKQLSLRLPFALLTAAFLAQILPLDLVADLVGPQSGLTGIALSSILGGLLPGGPMTSFPIALIVYEAGAGAPQIVALITGWSVFALHRVIAWEAPLMGWGFVALRMVACAVLPILAGLFTAALLATVPNILILPD